MIDFETENDALQRKVNDLESELSSLGNDFLDAVADYQNLNNELDDTKWKLKEAEDRVDFMNDIMNKHPDEIWKWFCDSLGVPYYDKDGLLSKIENKLKESTYYQS